MSFIFTLKMSNQVVNIAASDIFSATILLEKKGGDAMKKEEFVKKVLKIKKENKDDYKKIIDKINELRQVK